MSLLCVLERNDKAGYYFPRNENPDCTAIVGEITQAEVFEIWVAGGSIRCRPEHLPRNNLWKLRPIKLEIT